MPSMLVHPGIPQFEEPPSIAADGPADEDEDYEDDADLDDSEEDEDECPRCVQELSFSNFCKRDFGKDFGMCRMTAAEAGDRNLSTRDIHMLMSFFRR